MSREVREFEEVHAGHLHRRGGEDFERRPADTPEREWLICPCGAQTLVAAVARELSTSEATTALSSVFTDLVTRLHLSDPVSSLSMRGRIEAFKRAYPDHPASWPHLVQEDGRDVIYGVWLTGREYENDSTFYGTYPPRYLAQLMALFPDVAPSDILHVFSGALPSGEYVRLDRNPLLKPDVLGDVYDAPAIFPTRRFKLIIADPPYSIYDAAKYQALCDGTLDIKFATGRRRDVDTPGIDQLRTTNALAAVLAPGGMVAWLDTTWPMHSKDSLVTVGRIFVVGSTMHRFRGVSLLKRAA